MHECLSEARGERTNRHSSERPTEEDHPFRGSTTIAMLCAPTTASSLEVALSTSCWISNVMVGVLSTCRQQRAVSSHSSTLHAQRALYSPSRISFSICTSPAPPRSSQRALTSAKLAILNSFPTATTRSTPRTRTIRLFLAPAFDASSRGREVEPREMADREGEAGRASSEREGWVERDGRTGGGRVKMSCAGREDSHATTIAAPAGVLIRWRSRAKSSRIRVGGGRLSSSAPTARSILGSSARWETAHSEYSLRSEPPHADHHPPAAPRGPRLPTSRQSSSNARSRS